MDFEEFKTANIRRGKKDFRVRNSYNIRQIYKYIQKNKWKDIGKPVKDHDFYKVVRNVNNLLAENIVNGEAIAFPAGMGKLELRKFERKVGIKDGKLKIGYPIDWNETWKLWYEDEEAHKNKTLIRFEDKYTFRIRYNKYHAKYENMVFYDFVPHAKVRKALKNNIKNGIVTDTLW